MARPVTRPGELLRDTLDMLVLKTLMRGAMHGYAIAEFIEETTEDVLRVEEGALIPHCIAWNCVDWWRPNGASRKTTGVLATTG